MKKIILTYGSIAGIIVILMLTVSVYLFYNNPDYKLSEVIGYTGMLVAFTFVFIGIKNFRDKQNDGVISFGKAFTIGALITLIASTCYVGAWLIEYYVFFPDFMDKYMVTMVKCAKESGLSAAELAAKKSEMNMYAAWYKNPILVILLTYMEILPLGLVIALISALILKKKKAIV